MRLKRAVSKKDLWHTVSRLEEALVAKDVEMEELEEKLESYVTIRPTDVPDRYDMWDGSVLLLKGATTTEVANFLR